MAPRCASWPKAGTIPELPMELKARSASKDAPFELDIMLFKLPATTLIRFRADEVQVPVLTAGRGLPYPIQEVKWKLRVQGAAL